MNCLSILRSTIITNQSAYVYSQRRKKKVFYTVLKRHCGQYVRVTAAKMLKKNLPRPPVQIIIKTQGK